MKVRDVMRERPRVASPGQSLAVAGQIMAEIEAGVLPVLGRDERLEGVLTDRDVCVALSTRDEKASDVLVHQAMSQCAYTCREADELAVALGEMRHHRVRRLPVVGEDLRLVGLLCLDDVAALAAEGGANGDGPTYAEVAETLKAVNRHDLPVHTTHH